MKKLFLVLISITTLFMIMGCTGNTETPEPTIETPIETVYYDVTFQSNGGSQVTTQSVVANGFVSEPTDPTREGYVFVYWYTTNQDVEYVFSTPVTADLVLNAFWQVKPDDEEQKTNEEKIQEDIDAILSNFVVSRYQVSTPSRGPIHNSIVRWSTTSKYISITGVVLPIPTTETVTSQKLNARLTLDGTVVNYGFDVTLSPVDEVVISVERVVPFTNLTKEYEVASSNVTLLFEEDGSVPYIKVQDFFNLLEGFIDPAYEITFTTSEGILTIFYQYYDEDEDQLYDLELIIDSIENTLTTNDPGFYWAYVYSTATNFGRHIYYDNDNPNAYYKEGVDVVYDLDDYGMDIVVYEDEVVLPYYIANQLFAGSSYYNVYYNYDNLYGIYSLPDDDSDEYAKIKESTKNSTSIPADLVVHNFNFLAFSMNMFYGLKEIMEVDDYYDMLFEIKDSLLNVSANRLDEAIGNFLVKTIDEPHTSYGYPGYFNAKTYTGPSYSSLTAYGTRFQSWYNNGLIATDNAIKAKWGITGSAWAASNPLRPRYWFLDAEKTKAVLALDSFRTADIEEDTLWDATYVNTYMKVEDSLLAPLVGGSKYFYFNASTHEYQAAHVLVKGLTATDAENYREAMVALGFSRDGIKLEKTVNGVVYVARVQYDTTLSIMTVSIISFAESLATVDRPTQSQTPLDLVNSDSAIYMEMMLEQIMLESSAVKTILLDITWNTGGNVGALYRVVGFITGEPFAVSRINGSSKSASKSFVYIDGVPRYDHLDWGLLVSHVSFSAANSLATIFIENDLGPVIGLKTGGGASSITPILLPNGTAFTMSSNSINAYTTGDGSEENPFVFVSNEFGITPTNLISINDLYNPLVLIPILDASFLPETT